MITFEHTSNINAVLLEALSMQVGDHALTVQNDAEYAAALNAKDGYSVISKAIMGDAVDEAIVERIDTKHANGEPFTDADAVAALDDAGAAAIAEHRRIIGTTDRPGKHRPPPRPLHRDPLNWADDTNKLRNSYQHAVDDGPMQSHTD